MSDKLGERFIRSAAARDFVEACELLSPEVDFRALTPRKTWVAHNPDEVAEIIEKWFGPTEEIEAIESATVIDQPGVRYRVRCSSDNGAFVFEQQAYYDVADERIIRIRIVCSGDRPVARAA
jgi:hypothetical protein